MALFCDFFPLCVVIHPYTYRASVQLCAGWCRAWESLTCLLWSFAFRYSAFNFCFSFSSWFCYVVSSFSDVSFLCFEHSRNLRCKLCQRACGVFSKGKFCDGSLWEGSEQSHYFLPRLRSYTKNCTKTNVLVQHRFTFEAISCLLPIQGRWVCSPCRGCWWFAHRDRPWGVYGVWWCKRP